MLCYFIFLNNIGKEILNEFLKTTTRVRPVTQRSIWVLPRPVAPIKTSQSICPNWQIHMQVHCRMYFAFCIPFDLPVLGFNVVESFAKICRTSTQMYLQDSLRLTLDSKETWKTKIIPLELVQMLLLLMQSRVLWAQRNVIHG